MNFFIVEGNFIDSSTVDRAVLEKSVQQHIAYLDKGFADGSILVSGPKAEEGGGFIIMKAESETEVFEFLEADPMKKAGVQNYIVKEFHIHKALPFAKDWFTS
jgi:uncharacterized protein YciI